MTIQHGRLYRRAEISDADWQAHAWERAYFVGTPDDLWLCVGIRPRALGEADIIEVEARPVDALLPSERPG